jgi:hypothetical protein
MNGMGMMEKGGRTMSEIKELTTALNEVAILEKQIRKSQKTMRTIIIIHTSDPM